ncbi:unnamed protein product [Eruca vesicaria subsp. sativa]|uniref:C3H1-type domain-containing protein n=1 Tax=Eruca vesicaria subsp. sativa TaxID=29727 RepID=A0ABC8LJ44_ERUVS|nr:unnamed protein product [Eruca vesicaria subsp. sativa]
MSGGALYKTKLCIVYTKSGNCSKPNCTFAHGVSELRRPAESSSFTGRRHNLDGDLREKLGRQFSPERRPSLDRSGRRVQRFNGHENPRSFEKRRDVDYRENRRYDERSDYSGGLKAGSRIEVRERDERNKFLGYNNVLEEQLKDVKIDVKMLTDDKLRLEATVERKAREVDILTSRIQELGTQLDRQKEEFKSITSSSKKFVKECNRFLRAKDEVKRSEARLQKLCSQLSTYFLGNEGNDSETDIVSDEEKNGRNLRTASYLQNELQNTSPLSRKRHHMEQYTAKASVKDALIGRREEDRLENVKSSSRWNTGPSKSFSEEESRGRNEEDTMNKSSSKEDARKRRRLSSGTSSSNKVMSYMSMATRESGEVAEFDEENTRAAKGSPLISLPPPPPFRDAHFKGDEEKANVDVIEQSKANDVDSV